MAAWSLPHVARRHSLATSQSDIVLSFLAPCLNNSAIGPRIATAKFTTSPQCNYPRRDNNRNRGISAIRSTGLRPRQTLSILKEPIPKPRAEKDRPRATLLEIDPNHGLWGFFNKEKRIIATLDEDASYGRAWTMEELRHKSWEDIHGLWWVCVKDRNRIATEKLERARIQAGYGEWEASERDKTIQTTQRNIMATLTERWYAWEAARKDARDDPEVNLSGEGDAYTPLTQEDYQKPEVEEIEEITEEQAAAIKAGQPHI